jgi:hypothetical protein
MQGSSKGGSNAGIGPVAAVRSSEASSGRQPVRRRRRRSVGAFTATSFGNNVSIIYIDRERAQRAIAIDERSWQRAPGERT